MLSEAQQIRVWEGMLGAETRANYFAELSSRYMQKQRLATWATLLFSSGAVASLLANVPSEWKLALAIATTAVSLYSVVMQNQKLAVDASDLHARWNRLAKEYGRVWENVYAGDAAAKPLSMIAPSTYRNPERHFPTNERRCFDGNGTW